jgi:hypothetical protein
MSKIKISGRLFLESQELNRIQKFLNDQGFTREMLLNSKSFGIVKNPRTAGSSIETKDNLRVLAAGAPANEIIVKKGFAVNYDGNILYLPSDKNFVVPADNQYYWVKSKYKFIHEEVGTCDIDVGGNVTGNGTLFLEVLRGMPNFASKIKFTNSALNTGEYDVNDVISNTSLVLNGGTTFAAEVGLTYSVIGTFAPGYVVPGGDKEIFEYDSIDLTLVQSIAKPAAGGGEVFGSNTFFLGRVKYDGATMLVEDRREDWYQTKADYELMKPLVANNPLIGLIDLNKDSNFTSKNDSIGTIQWTFSGTTYTFTANSNVVTISVGSGGKYKDANAFVNGDFNNWRLYIGTEFTKIVNSVKSGTSIVLTLETIPQLLHSAPPAIVYVTPDYDEIEIEAIGENGNRLFETYGINEASVRMRFPVLQASSTYDYTLKYRYKHKSLYSELTLFPTANPIFDEEGNPITLNLGIMPTKLLKPWILNDLRDIDDKTVIVGNAYTYVFVGEANYMKIKIDNYAALTQNQAIILRDENAVNANRFLLEIEGSNAAVDFDKIGNNWTFKLCGGSAIPLYDIYVFDEREISYSNRMLFYCIFNGVTNEWNAVPIDINQTVGDRDWIDMFPGGAVGVFQDSGLAGIAPASYKRVGNKIKLRGAVTCTDASVGPFAPNTPFFTLPYTISFPIIKSTIGLDSISSDVVTPTNPPGTTLYVKTTGDMYLDNTSINGGNAISLDGIELEM